MGVLVESWQGLGCHKGKTHLALARNCYSTPKMAASGLRVGRVVLVGSETMCRLQNQRQMKNALRSQLVSVSLRTCRVQNQHHMKNALCSQLVSVSLRMLSLWRAPHTKIWTISEPPWKPLGVFCEFWGPPNCCWKPLGWVLEAPVGSVIKLLQK